MDVVDTPVHAYDKPSEVTAKLLEDIVRSFALKAAFRVLEQAAGVIGCGGGEEGRQFMMIAGDIRALNEKISDRIDKLIELLPSDDEEEGTNAD